VTKAFEDLRAHLHARRLKMTKTRQLIFSEVVSTRDIHPNAHEIYGRLVKKGHRISLATVYRTLGLLVKSGLVSQVDLGEDHSHYEPEGPKTGHGHLICLSCGAVREFADDKFQRTIGKIGKANAFELDKFSIQVFGHCRKCKRK
jgi:Fur family ferric uptake transcriptional regulator